MDWRAAEELAARWMRATGFPDAVTTPAGADAGIDVVAANAIAQVKLESTPIGRPALQRLAGARAHQHHLALLFFSGSGFSAKAVEYADDMGVALLRFDRSGAVFTVNRHAEQIINAAKLADETLTARARAVGVLIVPGVDPTAIENEIRRREDARARADKLSRRIDEIRKFLAQSHRQWQARRDAFVRWRADRRASRRRISDVRTRERQRQAGLYRLVADAEAKRTPAASMSDSAPMLRPVRHRSAQRSLWVTLVLAAVMLLFILAGSAVGWLR